MKLAVSSLLEVVDSGAQTMEICIVRKGGSKEMISEDAIATIVRQIESEQQDATGGGGGGGSSAIGATATAVPASAWFKKDLIKYKYLYIIFKMEHDR